LLVVAWVVHGGSAAVAGVLPGDELLAINGSRVMKNNISDRLLKLVSGERVALLLSRHERVFELPAVVGEAIPDTFLIKAKARISSREKKRLEEWLGRELTFIKN